MQFCKNLGLLTFESAVYITLLFAIWEKEAFCLRSMLLSSGCDNIYSHKEVKEELGFVLNFVNAIFLFC